MNAHSIRPTEVGEHVEKTRVARIQHIGGNKLGHVTCRLRGDEDGKREMGGLFSGLQSRGEYTNVWWASVA